MRAYRMIPVVAAVALGILTLPAHSAPVRANASDIPYRIGGPLPAYGRSPGIAADAPYTPIVKSLIHQLLPDDPPTAAELTNAVQLFDGLINLGNNGSCHSVGYVAAPTGTTPSIAPLCWADSVGVNITSGSNAGRTSATAEPLAIGATFDTRLDSRFSGGAAPRIARAARRAGGSVFGEPTGFVVTGMTGPLRDGETDRARSWGGGLGLMLGGSDAQKAVSWLHCSNVRSRPVGWYDG